MKKVLIGVDPHKASVAVGALDEVGELIERATFPQNRAGLRSLERWAKRFGKRRPKRWRTLAASAGTWRGGWRRPASLWWTSRLSFRRGCGCSRAAMPARTMGSMPWPPRWPPRATNGWQRSIPRAHLRCYACFPRGAKICQPSVGGRSTACTGFYETSSPAGCPGRSRPTELHASCAAYGPRAPQPASAGSWLRRRAARHPDAGPKDRGPKRAHRSRGRGFRHHPHRDLRHRSHTGREDHRDCR